MKTIADGGDVGDGHLESRPTDRMWWGSLSGNMMAVVGKLGRETHGSPRQILHACKPSCGSLGGLDELQEKRWCVGGDGPWPPRVRSLRADFKVLHVLKLLSLMLEYPANSMDMYKCLVDTLDNIFNWRSWPRNTKFPYTTVQIQQKKRRAQSKHTRGCSLWLKVMAKARHQWQGKGERKIIAWSNFLIESPSEKWDLVNKLREDRRTKAQHLKS